MKGAICFVHIYSMLEFFSRMANLTREQYDSGYSRSALLRKGVKISRSLLQNGPWKPARSASDHRV